MRLIELDRLIRTVCPIDGITDSGFIVFREEATQQQRSVAEALVAQYINLVDDSAPDFGTINANALVRRRAKELQDSGQDVAALLLLKTIGE